MEEIQDLIKDAKTPVTLHVYAVGHAKAIQEINYVVENFLHEGGVFHGAIEVFGQEFSFGGCGGINAASSPASPRSAPCTLIRESIYLGDCGKDLPEVQAILDHMKSSWMGPTYDLLRKLLLLLGCVRASFGRGTHPEVGAPSGRCRCYFRRRRQGRGPRPPLRGRQGQGEWHGFVSQGAPAARRRRPRGLQGHEPSSLG